jgi:hypothetical protein
MYTVKLTHEAGNVTFTAKTLEDASEKYCELRDESYEGASTFGFGQVYKDTFDKRVAEISYNGRIWQR